MGWHLQIFLFLMLSAYVSGHARLSQPPSRSYMWRVGYDTPINYNDNQLNCGGAGKQWSEFGGKCGICGDAWDQKLPRDHEAGGKYGLGIIVEEYKSGSIVEVVVDVTANHKGYFEFRLCPTNDPKKTATKKCLDKYLLPQTNGDRRFNLSRDNGIFTLKLQLPKYLTCKHCVLQWTYHTGNSFGCWDKLDPESCCVGCGPVQEEFYSCADVAITYTGNTGLKVMPEKNPKPTQTTTSYAPTSTTTKRFKTPPKRTTTETVIIDENDIPESADQCFFFCLKTCNPTGKCPKYCKNCWLYPRE
ncbi:hypothetical protein SNE40_007098 [Patella caerulea]|uniref:Chitin-binding type-4 domain-containing protein n=1 Tax=Patella caerulea TaxID=87958 RepID=A0AAN8JYY2_PATCE